MTKVPCNDLGYRIGEGHHNCTIPDVVVRWMHAQHERAEDPIGWRRMPAAILVRFGLAVTAENCKKILSDKRRGQAPRMWREVENAPRVSIVPTLDQLQRPEARP